MDWLYWAIPLTIYLVAAIGLYVGIVIENVKQEIEFSPLQPITAFLWPIWLPFYLVAIFVNRRARS
jgi:hypothetical protein